MYIMAYHLDLCPNMSCVLSGLTFIAPLNYSQDITHMSHASSSNPILMHRAHHTILLHDCGSLCCLKMMSAAINRNFVLFVIVLSGICFHDLCFFADSCLPLHESCMCTQSTSCLCLLLLSLPYVNE